MPTPKPSDEPGRMWKLTGPNSMHTAMHAHWTMPDIADELDLRVETVHGYRSRKQMPEQSGIIGRTPYWTDAAIGPWIERQKARRKHKGQA